MTRLLDRFPRHFWLAGIAAFCFALLVYAWYLQYGPGKQQPCPLCILQRYAYFLIGVTALAGAVHRKAGYALAAALMALLGAGLATWQVLKGSEMTSCREDPIGVFVNGLPMVDWWPEYLFATGGCADRYSAFGVPVPLLSLLCFLALAAMLLTLAWRRQAATMRHG